VSWPCPVLAASDNAGQPVGGTCRALLPDADAVRGQARRFLHPAGGPAHSQRGRHLATEAETTPRIGGGGVARTGAALGVAALSLVASMRVLRWPLPTRMWGQPSRS